MNTFEKGAQLLEEVCGGGKDNVISLSTVRDGGDTPLPCPAVRDVDAYYENGVFYITTYAKSAKMQQIEENRNVAFSVHFEGISGSGTGENLGWVMEPRNAALRSKLRAAFADWYDAANNEASEDTVILAVRIEKAVVFRDHGAEQYKIDFINKTGME